MRVEGMCARGEGNGAAGRAEMEEQAQAAATQKWRGKSSGMAQGRPPLCSQSAPLRIQGRKMDTERENRITSS